MPERFAREPAPGADRESPPRGIGRGLAAILPEGRPGRDGLRQLPIELIAPNPDQPRTELGAEGLLALADSIRVRGVLQPIVVRPLPAGDYELIAGERRLRAAKIARLTEIPAIVRDAEEGDRLELALIENMAREDLNPIEEARACATLVEDLGITKDELAQRLGRSRAAISNLVRLLALPDEVHALIAAGELSEGHGRALLICKDEARRRALAGRATAEGWSVRVTEDRAREEEPATRAGAPAPSPLHPDLAESLAAAEDAMTAALGREVKVKMRGERCRVEFELDDPRDGVDLAERLLRRAAA